MDNLQNGIYSRLDTLAEKIRNVIKKKTNIKYPTLSKKRNKQTALATCGEILRSVTYAQFESQDEGKGSEKVQNGWKFLKTD